MPPGTKAFSWINNPGCLVLTFTMLMGGPFLGVGLHEAYQAAQMARAFVAAQGVFD